MDAAAQTGEAVLPSTDPRPPITIQQRLIALGEVLLCSGVITQTSIGNILQLAGWPAEDAPGHLSLPFVLTMSLADTLVLLTIMVALTRAHGESPTELWIGRRGIKREAGLGMLLIPVVFLGVVVLLNLMRILAPWLHNVPTNPLESLAGTTIIDAAMFALVAIVAGGVREELQRAFLLRRFEQYLGGPAVGVIVLSIAFGLAHYVQGWDAVITTGTLGAFWAIVYLKRRSSVAPIVSHAGFNALEILRVTLTG